MPPRTLFEVRAALPEGEYRVGNMSNAATDQLKRVIETQLGGRAAFKQSLRVIAGPKAPPNWDGLVHVFDLKDHPAKSKRAYAWSSTIKGGYKPRYFAVLHGGRVNGPAEAVRAALAAMKNLGKKK
jgi:hypothetical protein